MAQTQQKTTPSQGKSVVSSSAGSEKPASGLRLPFNLPFRLPSLRPPTGADAKPRSGWSRLFTGMLILLIGLYAINFLIVFVISHLPRSAQDALVAPLASKNTFLLGGLSGEELIFLLLMGGLYIALLRYQIIPRDPFNSRAKAEARVAARRGGPVNTVNLNPQTRASRRQAAANAASVAATAAANAKNGKNGKVLAKTPAPLMKTKAGQASGTAQSGVRAKTEVAAGRSGAHDLEYERVKALQRQQRRREAKR